MRCLHVDLWISCDQAKVWYVIRFHGFHANIENDRTDTVCFHFMSLCPVCLFKKTDIQGDHSTRQSHSKLRHLSLFLISFLT